MANICVTRKNKNIPSTMATQHPDNANKAYWHVCPSSDHACEFISTNEEIEECFRSFSDLGCDEYMWDWEGKFVDEAVIDRLYSKYFYYFKKKQIGKDKFLTFRVPNIWKEKTSRIARAFTGILSANSEAGRLKLNKPPIFEVVLPQTEDASKLIYIQNQFHKISKHYCRIFEEKCNFNHFSIIPLIEGSLNLIESKKILLDYLKKYNKKFKCFVSYIRPFIARSDPALNSGFVPAVIAAKAAISEYYKFEKETNVNVYPIIGVGSLFFRGGLSPKTVDEFIKQYKGIRTVTVQSSFRYDNKIKDVKLAINKLNKKLPKIKPVIYNETEINSIKKIDKIFTIHYQKALDGIAPMVVRIAKHIPSHRERIEFIGKKGYGRTVGKIKTTLPRAIKFTASLYSVGIPPEFIGTGKGINDLIENGSIKDLEKIHLNLKRDLLSIGNYLNKDNLNLLSKKIKGFDLIKKDISLIENYTGKNLDPKNIEGFNHQKETGKILSLILKNKYAGNNILEAARIRKSLG